ncbi:MAG: insulinase family protein [Anaerolineales bacterium]|nr:insulinase family protein [Chloroflexota bacterium]MBL6979645.1 insulinase family protein [Anaerolineales bacterium]
MKQLSVNSGQWSVVASSLPGPDDITRVELSNGITVLARSNFNSPSVSVSGYLHVGGLFDPDEKLGLADYVSAALMRGTEKRDFQEIYQAMESVGAALSFNGATHTTGFGGKSLAEDLSLLMELISEGLRQPVFPDQQIERLRAQLLTGLTLRAQDTRDMAGMAFDQIVYKDHPYSRPEDGYPETVQAITRQDLVDFHKKHYGPRGLVIAVVGGVSPEDAVDKVRAALGDWQNPDQPHPPQIPSVTPLEELVTHRVEIAGKSQADIVIGASGLARKSEDFLPASLGNSVFGQFGMMGRIGEAVREKAGLAYYAYSSMSAGMGPGPWAVNAGINPDNIDKATELIRAEIKRFVNEPVEDDELADSKANFIGRLPLALESNGGVAGAMINLERYDLGMDYYLRYAERIEAVTKEDVLAAASKYLHPDKLAVAIAGS